MFTPGGQAFIGGIVGGILGGAATATAIAGTAITWGGITAGAITGGFMGGLNAALAGGDLGDVLRGAVVGAVQGAISSGPLHAMESSAQGLSMGTLKHVVGHGVVGGAANAAMGGKFQDGFLSGAASAAAVHTGLTSLKQGSTGADLGAVGRTAVAGIIGGTASALGGGKFANGAYTAAFQHMLNAEIIPRARLLVSDDFLYYASSQLGVDEHIHPNIIKKYHASTSLAVSLQKPSTAWCSSFINWVFEWAGNSGTNSAGSQSWLHWGKKSDVAVVGAIAVFTTKYVEDKNGKLIQVQGHVTFVKGVTQNGIILGLGGNQGDKVKVSEYSTNSWQDIKGRPLGFRGYRIPSWQNPRDGIVAPILPSINGTKKESIR